MRSNYSRQAICLAPSRELARQIQEVVDKIGQFTDVKTFLAVPQNWKRGVKIQQHVLIGTPGTLLDMMSRGTTIFDPKLIRVFVLDEADEMIAQQDRGAGLGDQTLRIKRSVGNRALIMNRADGQKPATRMPDRALLCYLPG
jgi:ATP-dependent RNA helicase DDX19/DBP5